MRFRAISKSTIKLLVLLLLYKILFLSLTYYWSVKCLDDFGFRNYYYNFHWPLNHNASSPDFFRTWDAQPYLYLSENGYADWHWPALSQFAYYPLWPAAISFASHVISDPLICGLILANVFSLAAWILLFRILGKSYGRKMAAWSLLFMVCFPGALFFQFPYSESLFLLLTVLFFYAMRAKNLPLTIGAAILLPLTRAVGVLLFLPALVGEWRTERKLWRYAPALAIALGFTLYLVFMAVVAGDCTAGFKAQSGFMSQASLSRVFDLAAFCKLICTVSGLHDFTGSLVDRLMFVLLLVSLYPTYRLNKAFFVYSLVLGVLPAMTSQFMSYTRYAAVVFPMFVVAGSFFSKPGRTSFGAVLALLLLALQVWMLWQHVRFYWAG